LEHDIYHHLRKDVGTCKQEGFLKRNEKEFDVDGTHGHVCERYFVPASGVIMFMLEAVVEVEYLSLH